MLAQDPARFVRRAAASFKCFAPVSPSRAFHCLTRHPLNGRQAKRSFHWSALDPRSFRFPKRVLPGGGAFLEAGHTDAWLRGPSHLGTCPHSPHLSSVPAPLGSERRLSEVSEHERGSSVALSVTRRCTPLEGPFPSRPSPCQRLDASIPFARTPSSLSHHASAPESYRGVSRLQGGGVTVSSDRGWAVSPRSPSTPEILRSRCTLNRLQ